MLEGMKMFAWGTFLLFCGMTLTAREPVRVSAWYWLNSAPRGEWSRDFRNMADLGFTDVALCWGLDAATWALRTEDTRYALDQARAAGIGAYFIVWHPVHNSLPRRPEYQQMDAGGHLRFAFDTFNPEWRGTQWKQYLETVARLYAKHPAFAGYVFDDTFGMGPISTIDGPPGKREERYISYNNADRRLFGKAPPKSPSEPRWADWTQARAAWWEQWSRDTVAFLRAMDPNRAHDIYVEDVVNTIFSPEVRDRVGLDFARAARPWDAVGAYTTPKWSDDPQSGRKAVELTHDTLRKVRGAVGAEKKIIYTFWSANLAELNNAGPARYPTVAQLREVCEAALADGIRHLEMYGYRIGDYVVTAESWLRKRPPATGPYPITGQYPHKFLYDRPELHDALRAYLRSLRNR
jgi:hypothetical protein